MISIRLAMPDHPTGRLSGFAYFWAQWVSDFNPHTHCLYCLVGHRNRAVFPAMELNEWIRLIQPPEWKFLYVCGVKQGYNWNHNFHLVAAPGDAENDVARSVTWNGIRVEVQGGVQVPISDLPLGYAGMGPEFTTCRNWRFGVQEFGIAKLSEARPPKEPWDPGAHYQSRIRPLWGAIRHAQTPADFDAVAVRVGQVHSAKMRAPLEKELWLRARQILELGPAAASRFAREIGRPDLAALSLTLPVAPRLF